MKSKSCMCCCTWEVTHDIDLDSHEQSGRVVKAYEYYQTCIATKTFEFFGFLGEARNDTPNLTACCTNVPNLILLKIGHLCSSFVQVFQKRMIFNL